MSTITLIFNTKNATPPYLRGTLEITYNDGILDYSLYEAQVETRSSPREFNEVFGTSPIDSELQALNFKNAFNADYQQTGGQNNLRAEFLSPNKVVITSKKGSFTDFFWNGADIDITSDIENEVEPEPQIFTIERQNTGDCDEVRYTVNASGGAAPYRLIGSSNEYLNWGGGVSNVFLPRGHNLICWVLDANDNEISSRINVRVPKKLVPIEFPVDVTKYEGYADLLINSTNPVEGTLPLSYSLDGITYKSENTFTGILPGTYVLHIKDAYGCVITKTVVVDAVDAPAEQVRYLEISNLNSLAWYKKRREGEKRNFLNSKPTEEIANISHDVVQYIDVDDFVPTQFKSSYPYHNITYKDYSGKRVSIYPIKIQENMGYTEKVDCVLFPKNGKTAVYFNGGNEYEPDSSTIIDNSTYVNTLPNWVEIDRIVTITGLGAFKIDGIGYDEDIKYWYFTVNAFINAQIDSKVQVKYNIQDYDVYEVFLSGRSMDKKGYITLEAGYSFDEIDQTYETGNLVKITDNCSYLYLEWSDVYNKGGMVFQSETKHFVRIKGMFQPYIGSDSETAQGDDRSYNLYQSTKVDYKLTIPRLNVMMQDKINSAAALNGFKVNGLSLIKSKQGGEQYGLTNIGTLELDLLYSGNNVALRSDELVLNPSTGIIGGDTPPEEVNIVPYDGKTRLVTSNGVFVSIDGDFIEVVDV